MHMAIQGAIICVDRWTEQTLLLSLTLVQTRETHQSGPPPLSTLSLSLTHTHSLFLSLSLSDYPPSTMRAPFPFLGRHTK